MEIERIIPVGRENAISMHDLATAMHCSTREARAACERARRRGLPICSSCDPNGGGYYIAADKYEASAYLRQQMARIATARAAINAVEKAFEEGEKP